MGAEQAPGLGARRLALALTSDVLLGGRMLSEAMEARSAQSLALDPAHRARAQRLATETLRHLHRADSCLKPYLNKSPAGPTRAILRQAAVEICLDGEEGYAVVNSAVSLAKEDPRARRQAGLVNAVLRKVATNGCQQWARLSAPARLPDWLRGRLQSQFGARTVAAIEAAHDRGAPLDLTPRDDGDAGTLAAELDAEQLPTGSLRLARRTGAVSSLPGYDAGRWWVQDAAAALPARVLNPKDTESVLDLCAAPGGKTLQLAASGASVTALDISERRLGRLRENLDRTGLSAEIVVADALDYSARRFDAILLDAPCSATGTIRRHPDLPYIRGKAELAGLVALQAGLLDHALTLLEPGGRLVYCSCSLLAEEGETQAEAFLSRHPQIVADPDALDVPGVEEGWRGGPGLRLRPDYWPERGGMDGFFIAAFRRADVSPI